MSVFKYFMKIDVNCKASGGRYCQVQYWGPEAKTTEVEARVALIYASTDDCRPLTGRLKYRQWLTGSLQVDFQVVALASHASRQSS